MRKLSKTENNNPTAWNKIKYEHLAPKIDILNEDAKSFNESLRYALADPQIHNVAITGTYGSGKSSLISSYIENQNKKDKRFLKISLASFTIEKSLDESSDIDNEETILANYSQETKEKISTEIKKTSSTYIPFSILQKIEKSILQQIFYKESGFKLPFSRFKRIRNLGVVLNLILTSLVFILFLFPFRFFKEELWIKVKNIFLFNSGVETSLLFWLFIICLFTTIFFIIRFCNKIKINKLGFQTLDIDLDVKDNDSLLNKYVDEILYYFEVTDYEVVVFEDLDRFKNTEIFIKLRELNTLLNNYKKLKKHTRKKITFVYALLDDVFTDNSRTKFFDFIIPIIPVVDYQNSGDFLLNRKKENESTAFSDLDESFLLDIGLYVNDMRLLKNCINEFKIYDETINKNVYSNQNKEEIQTIVPHDRKKIFSIILYKNLYPKDFADLQNNEGYLYSIFQNKVIAIKSEKEKLEKEIIEVERKIEIIKEHSGLQIEDLRRRYVYKILQNINQFYRISDNDYLSDEVFNTVRKTNKISIEIQKYDSYRGLTSQKSDVSISFSSIERSIDPIYTYEQKETFIKQNTNGEVEKLQQQISEYKRKIKELSSLPASKIISNYNDTSFIPQNDKINRDLIIYFLRNDCIAEDYFDYISHFYPEALSKSDKDFILLIRNHSMPDFERSLIKCDNIIRRIYDADWRTPSILNNNLLSYLLDNNDANLETFLETIVEHDFNNNSESFFKQYNNSSDEKLSLFYSGIYQIAINQKNWVSKLFGNDLDKFYKFFILVEVSDNIEYIQFIKNHLQFLYRDLSNEEKEIIKNKLTKLAIQFELDDECCKYDIFNIIIDNKLYTLTSNNLSQIFNSQLGTQEKAITNYLTKVRQLENSAINEYVFENINDVMQFIILPLKAKLSEDEETAIAILNHDTISISDKKKFIEFNQVRISDITVISENIDSIEQDVQQELSILDSLFEQNKVSSNWNNILSYYSRGKDLTYLINFLNVPENTTKLSAALPISDDEMNDMGSDKYLLVKSFYDFIIREHRLNINSFKDLIMHCKFKYRKLEDYTIGDEKIKNMIETRALIFSSENYNGIKNYALNSLPVFVNAYFKEMLENENLISGTDLINCFTSDDVSVIHKNKLLTSEVSAWYKINDGDFLVKIASHIINVNLSEKLKLSFIHIANAIKNKPEKDDSLIKLLVIQFDNLSGDEIIKTLDMCGSPYSELCKKERNHMEIESSELHTQLCTKLQKRKLISSLKQKNDKLKIIRKRK